MERKDRIEELNEEFRKNALLAQVPPPAPALPAEPAMGVEDLPDAYRGVPLHPADARVAVVASWFIKLNAWSFAVSGKSQWYCSIEPDLHTACAFGNFHLT